MSGLKLRDVTHRRGDERSRTVYIGESERGNDHADERVIAWCPFQFDYEAPEFCVVYVSGLYQSRQHKFDPAKTDVAPLRAFAEGDMPAPVFADWLEEQGVDLPAEAFAILRGWVTQENTACD